MPRQRYSVGGTFYGREDGFYHSDFRYVVGGTFYGKSPYLMHYGKPGMQWGKRLFQNEDGSLTALGRARYGVGEAIGNAGNAIGSAANSAGRAIGGAASNAGRAVGNAAQSYAQTWQRGANRIANTANRYANEAGRQVQNATRAAGQAVGAAARNAIPAASQALGFDARRNMLDAESAANKAQRHLDTQESIQRSLRESGNARYAPQKYVSALNESSTANRLLRDAQNKYASTPLGMVENAGKAIGGVVDSAGRAISDTANNIDRSLNLGFGAKRDLDAAIQDRNRYDREFYNAGDNYLNQNRESYARRRDANSVADMLRDKANTSYNTSEQQRAAGDQYMRSVNDAGRAASDESGIVTGEQAAMQFLNAINNMAENEANAEKAYDMANRYGDQTRLLDKIADRIEDYSADVRDRDNANLDRLSERAQRAFDQYDAANDDARWAREEYNNSLLGRSSAVINSGIDWIKRMFGF